MAGDGPAEVLVLGLGNVLCSDDGAGVAALHRLMRAFTPPPGVRFIDGGTLGLALLDYIAPGGALILLDAVNADAPPGTLLRLEGGDVEEAVAGKLSPHQVGVADLLAAARFLARMPSEVVLLGVVPASLELGLERTPPVAAAIPRMIEAAVAEVSRLGHRLLPLVSADAVAVDAPDPLGL